MFGRVSLLVLLVACGPRIAVGDDPVVKGNVAPTGSTGPTGQTGLSGASGMLWPLAGTDGTDWVVNNYVDLDPSPGVRDYKGGAKSYDGHRGIDIDIASFRPMDAGVDIVASRGGVVERVISQYPDRHTACVDDLWNVVDVRHSDGSLAMYGHLRTHSPVVTVGQSVTAGQKLGQVGSSGCSTNAHLHFELLSAAGQVLEPFQIGWFAMPPVYDTEPRVMESVLKNGFFSDISELRDPRPDASTVSRGQPLGIGVTLAGIDAGDAIVFEYKRPGGVATLIGSLSPTEAYRRSHWWYNFVVPNEAPGLWTIRVKINGVLLHSKDITVN
jgi:hypothetical protein